MDLLNKHQKEDSKVTTCILGGDFAMAYNDINDIMRHCLKKNIQDDWGVYRWPDNDRAFLFKSDSGERFHVLTNMKKLMNWEDKHALVGAGIALASSQSIAASAQSRSTAAASASASAPSQSTATASASASVPSRGTASASALAPSRGVAATSSEQYKCQLREKLAQAAEKIVVYMQQTRQREANVQDNVKEEELAQFDTEQLVKLRVECETLRAEFEGALRMEALKLKNQGAVGAKEVEALRLSAEEATQEAKVNDQCNVTKAATRKLVRLVAAAKSTSAKGLESFEPLSRKTKELAAVMDVDGYSDDEVNDDDKDSDKFQAAARRRQHVREKILRDNASAPSRGVAAQGQSAMCTLAARKATREGNGWRWSDEPLQDLVQNMLQRPWRRLSSMLTTTVTTSRQRQS